MRMDQTDYSMQSAIWPPTITFTHNHMRPTHGGGCNSNASELPLVKHNNNIIFIFYFLKNIII
jgi:hypothetical protein